MNGWIDSLVGDEPGPVWKLGQGDESLSVPISGHPHAQRVFRGAFGTDPDAVKLVWVADGEDTPWRSLPLVDSQENITLRVGHAVLRFHSYLADDAAWPEGLRPIRTFHRCAKRYIYWPDRMTWECAKESERGDYIN